MSDVRQAIIQSLFPSGGDNGHYIHHLKIWEDMPGQQSANIDQKKPRYILLAVQRDGHVKIHKSKRNANGTFSIGKTWDLNELKTLHVANKSNFWIILNNKKYSWQTEHTPDQDDFLVTIVRCFRQYMNGRQPELINFDVGDIPGAPPAYQVPRTKALSPPLQQGQFGQFPPNQPRPGSRSGSTTPGAMPSRSGAPPTAVAPPLMTNTSNQSARSEHFSPPASSAGSGAPSFTSPFSNPSPFSNASPFSNPSPFGRRPPGPNLPTLNIPSPSLNNQGPSSMSPLAARPPRRPESPGLPPQRAPDRAPSPALRPPASMPLEKQPSASSIRTLPGGIQISRPATPSGLNPATQNQSQPPTQPPVSRPAPIQIDPRATNMPVSTAIERSLSQASDGPQLSPTSANRYRIPLPPPSEKSPEEQIIESKAQLLANVNAKTDRDETEDAEHTLLNVEEMLEGFEWRLDGGLVQESIEKRLLNELNALEAASIHAIIESDERVNGVLENIDTALNELDKMDSMISLYNAQLRAMSDDIAHIESQNAGLQVQASNQRSLMAELESLIDTLRISEEDLQRLRNGSLDNPDGVEQVEGAASALYKAILSTRQSTTSDARASMDRMTAYMRDADAFAKRFLDFLTSSLTSQCASLLGDRSRMPTKSRAVLADHDGLQETLGSFCGFMLFIKEIAEPRYQEICNAYFNNVGGLYKKEIGDLVLVLKSKSAKPNEDDANAFFTNMNSSTIKPFQRMTSIKAGARRQSIVPGAGPANPGRRGSIMPSFGGERRASIMPSFGGGDRRPSLMPSTSNPAFDADIPCSQAFRTFVREVNPAILTEMTFVTDFLAIQGVDLLTFADYMNMDSMFSKTALKDLAALMPKFKDVKTALETIFSFLSGEIKDWIDWALARDPLQVVGIMGALDLGIGEAEDENCTFLSTMLQKQRQRCLSNFERNVQEQVKAIEHTQLTVKKRQGIVPFIRVFPHYVSRIEAQLVDAERYPVRTAVDDAYKAIVDAMFEALQQLAKAIAGETQDKEELNYHVILIENMYLLNVACKSLTAPSLKPHMDRATDLYENNLNLYIKLVLRRPFSRLMDFFEGMEVMLRTNTAAEVAQHSSYNRAALKRTLLSTSSKEMRRSIETLYKRVEKHFDDQTVLSTENQEVIDTVWKATEDAAINLYASWRSLITKCYPEEATALDFNSEDITHAFKKAKS